MRNSNHSFGLNIVVIRQLHHSNLRHYCISISQHYGGHPDVLLFHNHCDENEWYRKHNLRIKMVQHAIQTAKKLHFGYSCCATAANIHGLRLGCLLSGNAPKGMISCYYFPNSLKGNTIFHLQILNTAFSFFLMFTNL